MPVPTKHVLSQAPTLKMLAGVALSALRPWTGRSTSLETPSERFAATIQPLPDDLIHDYVRHVGGDPSAYAGFVPPHLFPQWSFPLASKTLRGVPYPLIRVLNGGCRLRIRAPLPAGVPLRAWSRLEDVDDNGRRAVLHQRVVTGTDEAPDALEADLYAIVVHDKSARKQAAPDAPAKPKPRVPHAAEELARWKLRADAGLDFAKLTGDFNPVHWIPPYARAFGFRNTILHGFSTMARAIEGIQRNVFAGSVHAITTVDVQFTKPLALPANVGLYLAEDEGDGRRIFVGEAPGGPAYLTGTFR